ncbi:hypothetical protein TCAL_17390 [Tigriopus californicus]|uniref:Amino acid permease/ SLC12A domain-containing protein n=1 Tax=Tigriopus californicus TaxID=6832 RepID=A0A553NNL9_TIGCA|nr:hypothetical protein TCAL_17390 [Tigriopus californicus]
MAGITSRTKYTSLDDTVEDKLGYFAQKMTVEAFPSERYYRRSSSVHFNENRPTIEELKTGLAKSEDLEFGKHVPFHDEAFKMGWMKGVLMPCLLNIWGVMLFLRLSWVVGQCGIFQAILVITLCNVVTFITSLSMSAVSTNGKIKGGGIYYMISRSLGAEFGGAIGVLLTIANSIAVATYLIDPAEAIPKGTLSAIGLTYITYIGYAIMIGSCYLSETSGDPAEYIAFLNGSESIDVFSYDNCTLRKCDYGSSNDQQISYTSYLVFAGCFAATLSSAIASLVGAPRVLQALAKDKLYPLIGFFANGYGKNNEPIRGYVLSFLIALGCVMIGNLDVVSSLLSNFFVAAYALINFSVFHASMVKSPGWRPAFKYYNQWVSLIGTFLCVAVMFLMDPITAFITIACVGILYFYIKYRKPEAHWGSSTEAQQFVNTLQNVHELSNAPDHVKNFRPKAFYFVAKDRTFEEGAMSCMSLAGLGKFSPNMILLGYKQNWFDDESGTCQYYNILHEALDMNLGLSILRLPSQDGNLVPSAVLDDINIFKRKKQQGVIDIWWLYDDGGLTLLLPVILKTRKQFGECQLRVFALGSKVDDLDSETKNMAKLLKKFRICCADVIIIPPVTTDAKEDSLVRFEEICNRANTPINQLLENKERSNRFLRLAEILQERSEHSQLVVMTLPMPRPNFICSSLYMSWLEIMSCDMAMPFLFVRGNQTSVLTFYS